MSRAESNRSELPDGLRRRLLATFRYIDELLEDAERKLAPDAAARPFLPYVADATPVQAKVIGDYAGRIRKEMLAALRRLHLAPPAADISAVWAARSSLGGAQIAATELAARHMRGYGAVADELARELNLASATIGDLLDSMDSYLARGSGRDLAERLARIGPARDGQALLAEIEHLVTAHGLVELRPALEAVVERLESDSLEVAVFGRVSSGKSSLLNAVVGQEILPVGVTPVTAVPTRIVYGARPEGTAWFVDAQTETFALGRLAEFANEHQNPGNVRHVTRLQIALPNPLLQGVTLVDTPGLGSLARAGAAEALAYLPRCDIGILLVDAASTLTPEDAALADALVRAGAQVMVLLTKADLLGDDDRVTAESYVQRELAAVAGLQMPVHSVSVKGDAAMLCARWVDTVLKPCLRDRQRLRETATARKIDSLAADVVASLERRLAPAVAGAAEPKATGEAQGALREALVEFDRLRRAAPSFPDPATAAEDILAEAAHNAAEIWRREYTPSFDATAIVTASLDGRAGAAADAIRRDIGAARTRLANALAAAARQAPEMQSAADELARPSALPVLNGSALLPQVTVERRAFEPPLRILLARTLRHRFEELRLPDAIAAALAQHGRLLDAWRAESLDAVRRGFVAASERIAARLGPFEAAAPASATALRDDLQRLRRQRSAPDAAEAELAAH